jgi:protein ImuB
VEVADPGRVHLDLAGLATLLGAEPRLGQRLLDALAAVDLSAHVAIADTRTAATLAARAASGLTLMPPGRARAALASWPVALLDPPPDLAASLERWGIRTLGALAALPRAALLARLGTQGARLQRLARGEDAAPFVAHVPPETWAEALALEWEVASLDALAFVLRRLLERLAARLALRERGAAALQLTLALAGGGAHAHRLPLAAPLREPRTLLALLLADLERLTLPAPVVALRLEVETAPLAALQADLFAPPRPSPRELGETLGRLVALVGPDRVGAPVLADTHRPGALGVGPFRDGQESRPPGAARDRATPTCRRLVPPLPATVELAAGRPARVDTPGPRGVVLACAGPWRTAGEWWADTAWTREEWEVALPDGAVYRLALDQASGAWSLDAVVD